jgi:hypothetical protein
MSYGTETGQMILAYLRVTKLKQHQVSKPPDLLDLRDA